MNFRRATAFVFVPSFVALVACSGKADDASGDPCQAYVNAIVGYVARCGGGYDGSSEAKSQLTAACTRALAAPGQSGLGDALSSCASRLSGASCKSLDAGDCKLPKGTLADGTACADGFQCTSGFCKKTSSQSTDVACGTCAPTVAAGGACESSDECAEGLDCVHEGGAQSGTCKAPALAKAGETCEPFDAKACAPGLVCNAGGDSAGPYTCQTPAKAGAKCIADYACEGDLVCERQTETCAAPAKEGASCATAQCANGLGCDPDTKTCKKPTSVALGAACDAVVRYCAQGYCKGASHEFDSETGAETVTPGTCTAYLADGAACVTESTPGGDAPPKCGEGSDCVNGTCTPNDPATCK